MEFFLRVVFLDFGLVLKIADPNAAFVVQAESDIAGIRLVEKGLAIDLTPAGFTYTRSAGIDLGLRAAGLLPAAHLGWVKPEQQTGAILRKLFLKFLNEPLAFRFGGEETALQSSLHIPPRFIFFNLFGSVVSFDIHVTLTLAK